MRQYFNVFTAYLVMGLLIFLVGIFQSHPNSTASPSNLDKKFMKANGDIPWIIFSGINTDLSAFILEQDMENMEEIKIKIMERHFFQ